MHSWQCLWTAKSYSRDWQSGSTLLFHIQLWPQAVTPLKAGLCMLTGRKDVPIALEYAH